MIPSKIYENAGIIGRNRARSHIKSIIPSSLDSGSQVQPTFTQKIISFSSFMCLVWSERGCGAQKTAKIPFCNHSTPTIKSIKYDCKLIKLYILYVSGRLFSFIWILHFLT